MTQPQFTSLMDAVTQARKARAEGRDVEAANVYRQLLRAFPDEKKSLAIAADGLLECGLWSEAVALLNGALKTMPVSPLVLQRLAAAYASMGNFKKAAGYLQQHATRDPTAANWIAAARLQGQAADWVGAEISYSQALAVDPDSEEGALGLGDALFQLGRSTEAIKAYRRVTNKGTTNFQAFFRLGSILLHENQLEESLRRLRQAVALGPESAPAHINLATVMYRLGGLAKAVVIARRAAELDPKSALAHFTLGILLLHLAQIGKAAVALRTAVAIEPGYVEALLILATAETQLGNTVAAEQALQRILPIEPSNLEARHLLAALHGEAVRTVPEGYTRQLFDWYASRFDSYLVNALEYQTPADMARLLDENRPPIGYSRLLDLGCGTGLVAAALAPHFTLTTKVGIDVSGKMLDVARGKGLYDTLIEADALEVMGTSSEFYDLITAGDVLIYVGDLAEWLPAISKRLSPGGRFAYSIETMDSGSYKLMPTGRFAHAPSYVEALGSNAGLVPVAAKTVILRKEAGKPVAGLVGVLEKPA